MAFSGGARRLCIKLSLVGGCGSGRHYSTSACKTAFSRCRETPAISFISGDANSQLGIGILLRRFSVAASEQTNLIKELRQRTSAPIKDVKAALIDSNWDIELAQKELRKRGKVLASKKSSRTAAEGLLALAQNESKAAVIELNCETDFVARNEIFQYLALSLAKQALLVENSSQQVSGSFHVGPESLEDMTLNLEHPKINGEATVQNAITEVAAMMGENVKFRRVFVMPTSPQGVISTYLHTSPKPGLGRIAGILSLEVDDGKTQSDAIQRVGSELAMHVVAAKPLFLTKELVSSVVLENERDILKSQAEASGKPPMAINKMVEGRLRKYFEEVVLLEQKFIINDTMNVKTPMTSMFQHSLELEDAEVGSLDAPVMADCAITTRLILHKWAGALIPYAQPETETEKAVLDNLSKEVGSSVKVGSFVRMEVGEGIGRQEADASEPVSQAV